MLTKMVHNLWRAHPGENSALEKFRARLAEIDPHVRECLGWLGFSIMVGLLFYFA